MNIFKWLYGNKDKEQIARSIRVEVYVDNKKTSFIKEMDKIKKEAIATHKSTRKAHVKSAKLLEVVDEITNQLTRSMNPNI